MSTRSSVMSAFVLSLSLPTCYAQSDDKGAPPERSFGGYVRDVASGCDGSSTAKAVSCATGIAGTAFDTAKVIGDVNLFRGATGDGVGLKTIGNAGTVFGLVGDGARLYEDYQTGNSADAAELAFERGIDAAVGVGISSYMGPLAPIGDAAYGAGKLVGTMANHFVRPCSNARGESQTLKSCINDHVYWPIAEPIMDIWQDFEVERLTSNDVIDKFRRKRQRERSQEFANISSQNDAAAQSVSAQAALIQPGSVSAPSDPYESANTLNLWLGAINAARSFSTPVPPMTPIVNPSGGGACTKLDPKTGCHFGHDEKSHPGGCKKC